MVLNSQKVNYFTCLLCLLLLIIILLSKDILSDEKQYYFLIIIILLIIISCLLENNNLSWNFLFENFNNPILNDKTRNCYEKNKEHAGYSQKIESRLNNFRKIEEKNRENLKYDHENDKINELKIMNEDYLVNGESF